MPFIPTTLHTTALHHRRHRHSHATNSIHPHPHPHPLPHHLVHTHAHVTPIPTLSLIFAVSLPSRPHCPLHPHLHPSNAPSMAHGRAMMHIERDSEELVAANTTTNTNTTAAVEEPADATSPLNVSDASSSVRHIQCYSHNITTAPLASNTIRNQPQIDLTILTNELPPTTYPP